MSALDALVEEFDGRFRSGNHIPVDRIWLTRDMWERMRDIITASRVPDGWKITVDGEYVTAYAPDGYGYVWPSRPLTPINILYDLCKALHG